MAFPVPVNQFAQFLCDAKRATYASQEEDAKVKPIFSGSHQLEFRQGALLYRDLYYGGDFFAGLETVTFKEKPIWAMSYAGGINESLEPGQHPGIYDFLGAALREVPASAPFRGPETFEAGDFRYTNRILGEVHRFSGVETIYAQDHPVYQLHYNGGMIKE
ncbi:MAG: DUF5680 domain-containing protein [Anaerolineales bacterium]|nr:DUF5680 domain-containing protein [Anaerolineales bacterium]